MLSVVHKYTCMQHDCFLRPIRTLVLASHSKQYVKCQLPLASESSPSFANMSLEAWECATNKQKDFLKIPTTFLVTQHYQQPVWIDP